MTETILTASGVQFRQSQFRKPPEGAYAVYFDDVETSGPDRVLRPAAAGLPHVCKHDVTVELYAPLPATAAEAEAAIEAAITAQGIHWTKQDRLWIRSEQMYQTIYEFSYTEKRRT